MNRAESLRRAATIVCSVLVAALLLAGCGMPGAPQPPSLNLPERVTDLAAARNGDEVTLTWTVPRRNTDKLLLNGPVQARVCRTETGSSACTAAGTAQFAPGADASFTETLPPSLAAGTARGLTYTVELVNHKGRSAGLSNAVGVAAGETPGPLGGFTATMRRNGVLLAWAQGPQPARPTQIRLIRRLLTPPEPRQKSDEKKSGPFAPPAEPLERTLTVEAGPSNHALDTDVRFNERYEYRAQRIATAEANGVALVLPGPLSAPVEIETKNIFPPAVPAGLAAVGTAGENGAGPAIDLSWQPGVEPDLAGYIVYRREGDGDWQRISPAQPVVGPAFHDANVTAGRTYKYAVSSIDQEGHESARSKEAEETAPQKE